jgi:hypothetical protein
MKQYTFVLHISAEQYLEYYRGAARSILAEATTGQTVQFPASLVQRFVSTEGIHGNFVLTCDEHNKCVEMQRIPPE